MSIRRVACELALLCAGACCCLSLTSAPALARNLFTLEAHPEEAGVVATESAGTGYIAWVRRPAEGGKANTTLFCKIPLGGTCTAPIVLPLPAPGTSDTEDVSQAYPVIGTRPGVVYVVAPRYTPNDTLIWTSTNGGASFSAPKAVKAAGTGTDVDDVLINPLRTASEKEPTADIFDIATTNPGTIFNEAGNTGSAGAGFGFSKSTCFPEPGSLAFTAAGRPLIAYFGSCIAEPYEIHFYLNTGSPADEEKHWTGPEKVAFGAMPALTSGPKGLFMVSTDFPSGESQPPVLDLRKFNEKTDQFEAPLEISSRIIESRPATIYENPETGYLYVVWPVPNAAGEASYMAAESTNGGASFFGEREVATIRTSPEAPPRLSVAPDGQGWLTWDDEGGVEVANLKVGTGLSTTLSGGGQSGASIAVSQGTPVSDTATLVGQDAANATGSVGYEVFNNSSCAGSPVAAGSGALSGGVAAPFGESALAPGKYYWRVSYAGEDINEPSQSGCGSEVLTVLAPTTTTTVQSGDGVSGGSLTLPQGASVTDQAHVSGALAANATGTVTYRLYKDSKCTEEAAPASVASVAGGSAAPSKAVAPKVGTYYWKAEYSGDSANEGSVSACGSEVLVVAAYNKNIGLPSTKICLSKRKFIAHPRAPKGVKLVHVEIFINGVLKAQGPLNHDHTTIDLIGLPKGTFHVAMVVRSSTGKLYEDIRTYHTCVPGKPKKKK